MRVLVVGASGRLGQTIVHEALDRGHEVTALVRDPARLPLVHENLRLVTGDVLQIGEIDPAMARQNAVICCLGTKPSRGPTTLFSEGTGNIIRAMQRHNARRLLCITGAGTQIMQRMFQRGIHEDKIRQEELVRLCDRDWMVIRPARMTDGGAYGRYAVLLRSTGACPTSISRADVAQFTVAQLEKNKFLYKLALLTN